MASDVDICNLALSQLGDRATVASIDPPEGSAQAEHCARFYPVARDKLLELHSWKFALRRARLARLDAEAWNWDYAYAEPAGLLRAVKVLPGGAGSSEAGHAFEAMGDETGTALILTDLADATLLYTVRVDDTTKFSPIFTDALAKLLASYLAGPILKGDVGIEVGRAKYGEFMLALSEAKTSDANQRKAERDHTPDFLSARR